MIQARSSCHRALPDGRTPISFHRIQQLGYSLVPSMRRPVSVKSIFFFLPVSSLSSRRAASVAILPSALFYERFSLGANWAFPFQQVLLPDNRPWLPSLR